MGLRVGLLSGETGENWGVAADLVSPLGQCGSSSSSDSTGRQDSVTSDRPLFLDLLSLAPIASYCLFAERNVPAKNTRVGSVYYVFNSSLLRATPWIAVRAGKAWLVQFNVLRIYCTVPMNEWKSIFMPYRTLTFTFRIVSVEDNNRNF